MFLSTQVSPMELQILAQPTATEHPAPTRTQELGEGKQHSCFLFSERALRVPSAVLLV